jgi:hypothetical protein
MNVRRDADGKCNYSEVSCGETGLRTWPPTWSKCLPLFGAALDAARVTSGTRLLDAG